MTNAQELPVTEENISNLKVGDEYYEYDVTDPKEGTFRVIKNRWFACINNDPKRCIMFGDKRKVTGRPQCNTQKAIAEMLAKPKGFDVIFLEKAFIPVEV